jgi:uncharacterized protein
LALICDTGPILAALDRDDPDNRSCSQLLSESKEDLVVPGLVLAELDYWCRKLSIQPAWLTYMEDIEAGVWRIEWPARADLRRARELEELYSDLGLGVVDATVMALAERMRERKIATLDHRHFATVRPSHAESFQLLPDL